MPAGYNPDQWDSILEDAALKNGLDPDTLKAIARQENVDPRHNNPLGLSSKTAVKSFPDLDKATAAIYSQAKFITNPSGPFSDFSKTGDINDLAKVYSPYTPGGKPVENDLYNTNATEGAGIIANLARLKGQSPIATGTSTTAVPPLSVFVPPTSGPTLASAGAPASAVTQPTDPTVANKVGEMNLLLALQKLKGFGG